MMTNHSSITDRVILSLVLSLCFEAYHRSGFLRPVQLVRSSSRACQQHQQPLAELAVQLHVYYEAFRQAPYAFSHVHHWSYRDSIPPEAVRQI